MLCDMLQRGFLNFRVFHLYFLSHHDDHSGLVNNNVESNPEVKVITHKMCAQLIIIKTGANDKTRSGGYVCRRIHYVAKLHKMMHPEWSLTFPPHTVIEKDIIFGGDDDSLLNDLDVAGRNYIYSRSLR